MPEIVSARLCGLFLLACACSPSNARTQATEPVLRPWISESRLGWSFGADSLHASAPAPWDSVRKKPEVLDALIVIAESPVSMGLRRENAVLRIGGTGDPRAYEFLAREFDGFPCGSNLRRNALLAMGNGYPDRPPEYIYERLERALSSGCGADREVAAVALGDIMSPRALSILRARLPLEHSITILQWINKGLTKIQKP